MNLYKCIFSLHAGSKWLVGVVVSVILFMFSLMIVVCISLSLYRWCKCKREYRMGQGQQGNKPRTSSASYNSISNSVTFNSD